MNLLHRSHSAAPRRAATGRPTSTRRGRACGAICLSVALAAAGGPACSRGASSGSGDKKPVARVNGSDIPQTMVDEALDLFLSQRSGDAPAPSTEQRAGLRQQMIEALINQELFLQKARGEGIQPDAEEVGRRMKSLESRYDSHAAMLEGLQRAGLDEDKVKRLVERNLTIDAYLERHVRSQVKIADPEVESFYASHRDQMNRPEMVRASHILVLAEEGKATAEDRQKARQKAQGLLARARKGEDFAALARQNSDDGSSQRGGDLGFFPRGRMTPNFENAAFSLKVGALSGVVETPFGYHIIKVTAHESARVLQLAEVREPLRKRMEEEQTQQRSQDLVETLRKEAKIERLEEPAKKGEPAAAAPGAGDAGKGSGGGPQ